MTKTPHAAVLGRVDRGYLRELISRLVSIPSPDPPGRETEIARFVQERFQKVGLEVRCYPFDDDRSNLVARIRGHGSGPDLIFSAHFDTIPVGEMKWTHPPFGGTIRNGRVYGRGAADMKGGMAAMIVAVEALVQSGVALGGDLIAAFSAGESSSCVGAKRLLETGELCGAGALLLSEPSSLEILVAEKAALWVRATARGRTGHPSAGGRPMGSGINAIDRMVRFLTRLQTFAFQMAPHPLLGMPTIAVGMIQGGKAVNLTPDQCHADIDLRLIPGQDPDEVTAQLQMLAGSEVTLSRIDYKPAVETPVDHPFVELCRRARTAELGCAGITGGVSYYSDAAVLCPALGIPRVILGPGEAGMSGQRDEYVEVDKVASASRIFVQIALDYLGVSVAA